MDYIRNSLFILGLIIFSTEALETYHHHSLQAGESVIPLLIPVRQINNPGHLNDPSFAAKISGIDATLLKEAEPPSCPRLTLQSTATLVHTFFAVSASTGVFMFTCGDVLGVPPQTRAATAMVLWLLVSRAPGIADQFWSLFHSDPWENSKLVYQKGWRHHAANAVAGAFSMLNTSPWVYQMLIVERDYIYIFGIPAAPFYFLMNAHMNYKLAAPQIERYFYDYVYPGKSSSDTYAKRKKLMQSLKEAREVTAAISEDGVDLIFDTLMAQSAIVNSGALINEEKAQVFDPQDVVGNPPYRLLPDQSPDRGESAMGVLLGRPIETHSILSDGQELAWQNTKSANERVNDYPKLKRFLDTVTGGVSAFDAVAYGYVLWDILHFLPRGISITGCVIGGAWRWGVHKAPRQETVHTLVVDGLVKRSIGGLLDCKTLTVISLMGTVNAVMLTTIPYVMAKKTLESYPDEVQALLLGSLVAGNLLDYSRTLIKSDIALATADLSYRRLRQGPCSRIDHACRRVLGCFRSKIYNQKLSIGSYSERAERLVKQGTTNFLDNVSYYFLNQR